MKKKKTQKKSNTNKVQERDEPKWDGIPDRVTMINAYSHYGANYDNEDAILFLEKFLEEQERMEELEAIRKLNVNHFLPQIGFLARMRMNGMELRDESLQYFEQRLAKYVASVSEEDTEAVRKKVRKRRGEKKEVPVSYLPYSPDYDLTSIDPKDLTGQHMLITFNVKRNRIGYFRSSEGFKLERTTLKRVDMSTCKRARLTKAELHKVMEMSFKDFENWFNNLRGQPIKLSPRLNKHQLLLRTK